MGTSRVAVVLCGSGHRDGSEIRESVAVLWALSREGAQVECFAPDKPQYEVNDHLTGGELAGGPRNMLQESARIARGQIRPLDQLDPSAFDALLLPGGTGAAKNLADFYFKGAEGRLIPEFQKVLDAFRAQKKPIGAVCIMPALVGIGFKDAKLELTLGPPSDASKEMEKLGHKHVAHAANECHVDAENRVVTTPAYMIDDAPLHEVFEGIHQCVVKTLELARGNAR